MKRDECGGGGDGGGGGASASGGGRERMKGEGGMRRAHAAPRWGSMVVAGACEGRKWAVVMRWGYGRAMVSVKARAKRIFGLGFGEVEILRMGRGMQEWWCWYPLASARAVFQFVCAL